MLPTEPNTGSGASEPSAGNTPEAPRADLRDLGRWMRVIGWFELLAGSAVAGLWLLGRLVLISSAWLDAIAPDWRSWKLSGLATLGFGVLTLRAAGSVRRAARAAESVPPETAAAIERLKDLFEAQAFLLLFVVIVAIGTLLL